MKGDWNTLNTVKEYLKSVGSTIRGVVLEENGTATIMLMIIMIMFLAVTA